MEESGRVRGKGRIRSSIKKVSRRVPEKARMSVSTEKWKNPGEYLEKVESMQLLKNYLDEFRKRLESVSEPKIGRIRASTGKR